MGCGIRRGRAALRAATRNLGQNQEESYEKGLPPRAKPTELAFHRDVARFLELALPGDYDHTCFPAGGGGFYRGADLKRRGLKRGMPDHIIFGPDRKLLWIELKVSGGRVKPEQHGMHAKLRAFGHQVAVCFTLPEVKSVVQDFVSPSKLRAKLT
jgi:hypothetical protein